MNKLIPKLSDIAEIYDLTDNNDHVGALLLGARLLNADRLEARAEALQTKRDRIGYLDLSMYKEKLSIYKSLMNVAKSSMYKIDFDKFYMAY